MKEHGLLALAFCRHSNASLPFRGWTGWPYLPPRAPRPRSHLLSGQWGVEFHPVFPLERGCLLSSFHTIERKDKWLNSLQGIKASFSGWTLPSNGEWKRPFSAGYLQRLGAQCDCSGCHHPQKESPPTHTTETEVSAYAPAPRLPLLPPLFLPSAPTPRSGSKIGWSLQRFLLLIQRRIHPPERTI